MKGKKNEDLCVLSVSHSLHGFGRYSYMRKMAELLTIVILHLLSLKIEAILLEECCWKEKSHYL